MQRLANAGIHPTWISAQNELDLNTGYQCCRFSSTEDTSTAVIAISNPGFESGTTGWSLSVPVSTDASFTTDSLTDSWQSVSGLFVTGSQDSGTSVSVSLYLGTKAQTLKFDDFTAQFAPIAGIGPAIAAMYDSIGTLASNLRPQVIGPELYGIAQNQVEQYANKIDSTQVGAWDFHLYGGGSFLNPPSFLANMNSVSAHLKTRPLYS